MSNYKDIVMHNLIVCCTIQEMVLSGYRRGEDYTGTRDLFSEVAAYIYEKRYEKEWSFQEVFQLLSNNKKEETWDLTHLDKTAVSLP